MKSPIEIASDAVRSCDMILSITTVHEKLVGLHCRAYKTATGRKYIVLSRSTDEHP